MQEEFLLSRDQNNSIENMKYNGEFLNNKLQKLLDGIYNVKQLNTKQKNVKVFIDCASDLDCMSSIMNQEVLLFVNILLLVNMVASDSFSNRLQGCAQYFWNPLFIFRSVLIQKDFTHFQNLIINSYKKKLSSLQKKLLTLKTDDWQGGLQQLINQYEYEPQNKIISQRFELIHKIQHLLHFIQEIEEQPCNNTTLKNLRKGVWDIANIVYELLDKTTEDLQQSSMVFVNDRSDLAHFDAASLGISLFYFKLLQQHQNKFYYSIMNLPKITYISFKKSWDGLTEDVLNWLPFDQVKTNNSLQTIVIQDSSFNYAPYNLDYSGKNKTRENTYRICLDQIEFQNLSSNEQNFYMKKDKKEISSEDIVYLFDKIIFPLVRQHNPTLIMMNHNFSYSSENLPGLLSSSQAKYNLSPHDYAFIAQNLGILCNQKLIVISNNKLSDYYSELDLYKEEKKQQSNQQININQIHHDSLSKKKKIKCDELKVPIHQEITMNRIENQGDQFYLNSNNSISSFDNVLQYQIQNSSRVQSSLPNQIFTMQQQTLPAQHIQIQNSHIQQIEYQQNQIGNNYNSDFSRQLYNNEIKYYKSDNLNLLSDKQWMALYISNQSVNMNNQGSSNQYINKQSLNSSINSFQNYNTNQSYSNNGLQIQSMQSLNSSYPNNNFNYFAQNIPNINNLTPIENSSQYQQSYQNSYQQILNRQNPQECQSMRPYRIFIQQNNATQTNQNFFQTQQETVQQNYEGSQQSINNGQFNPIKQNQVDQIYMTNQNKNNNQQFTQSNKFEQVTQNKSVLLISQFNQMILSKVVLSYQAKLLCFQLELYLQSKLSKNKLETQSDTPNEQSQDRLIKTINSTIFEIKNKCNLSNYVQNWQLSLSQSENNKILEQIININPEKQHLADLNTIINDFNIESQELINILATIYYLYQQQNQIRKDRVLQFSEQNQVQISQERRFSQKTVEYFAQMAISSFYAVCEIYDMCSSINKKAQHFKNVSPYFAKYVDSLHNSLIIQKNPIKNLENESNLRTEKKSIKKRNQSNKNQNQTQQNCNNNIGNMELKVQDSCDSQNTSNSSFSKVCLDLTIVKDFSSSNTYEKGHSQNSNSQNSQEMSQEEKEKVNDVVNQLEQESSFKSLLFKYSTKIKNIKLINDFKIINSQTNKNSNLLIQQPTSTIDSNIKDDQAFLKLQELIQVKKQISNQLYDEIFDVRSNKKLKLRVQSQNDINKTQLFFFREDSQYLIIYLPNGLLEIYFFNIPNKNGYTHVILTQIENTDVFNLSYITPPRSQENIMIPSYEARFQSSLCYNENYVFKIFGLTKSWKIQTEPIIEVINRLTKERIILKLYSIPEAQKYSAVTDFSSISFKKDDINYLACFGGYDSERMSVTQTAMIQLNLNLEIYSFKEVLNKDFYLTESLELSKIQQNAQKSHQSISALEQSWKEKLERDKDFKKFWKKVPFFFPSSQSAYDCITDQMYVLGGNANKTKIPYKSSFLTSPLNQFNHCWENSLHIIKFNKVSENLSLKNVDFLNLDILNMNHIMHHNNLFNKHIKIEGFPFESVSISNELNPQNIQMENDEQNQNNNEDLLYSSHIKYQISTQFKDNNCYFGYIKSKTNETQQNFIFQSCTNALPKKDQFQIKSSKQQMNSLEPNHYEIISIMFSFETDPLPKISFQMK